MDTLEGFIEQAEAAQKRLNRNTSTDPFVLQALKDDAQNARLRLAWFVLSNRDTFIEWERQHVLRTSMLDGEE